MNAQERRNAIRSSLAIAPRPKMSQEKIGQLQELIFEAKELGDDALLLQLLQACTGALAELHAERARAAQSQP
jgi:hypothetical protein